MMIVNVQEIKPLIEGKCSPALFNQAFAINKIPFHIQWINKNVLEEAAIKHAKTLNFDPDTTLVLYANPPDEKPEPLDTSDPDDVFGRGLSKLNYTQCVCMFLENMTLQEFANKINQNESIPMIPEVGQHVKCMLKNGALAEGIVEEWYNNYVKLRACDHSSIIIIHHPEEDIVLTKIILDDDIADYKEPAENSTNNPVETELQKVIQEASGDLRNKRLAELKIELAREERRIIAEKLKDHHIGEVKKVQYGIPGFLKKPRSE